MVKVNLQRYSCFFKSRVCSVVPCTMHAFNLLEKTLWWLSFMWAVNLCIIIVFGFVSLCVLFSSWLGVHCWFEMLGCSSKSLTYKSMYCILCLICLSDWVVSASNSICRASFYVSLATNVQRKNQKTKQMKELMEKKRKRRREKRVMRVKEILVNLVLQVQKRGECLDEWTFYFVCRIHVGPGPLAY